MSEQRVTFEDLCSMIERGMDHDQACDWAAQGGLHITEEQRDHLERDLEVFDTSIIPDAIDGEDLESYDGIGDGDPAPLPTPEAQSGPKDQQPKAPEVKHLTREERLKCVFGLLCLIAVGTLIVRFITT